MLKKVICAVVLNALRFVEFTKTVLLLMLICVCVIVEFSSKDMVDGKSIVPFSVLKVTLVRFTMLFVSVVIQFALLLNVTFVKFADAFSTTSANASLLARSVTLVTVILLVLVKLKPKLFVLPFTKAQLRTETLFFPMLVTANVCELPALFQVTIKPRQSSSTSFPLRLTAEEFDERFMVSVALWLIVCGVFKTDSVAVYAVNPVTLKV